jgi:uroporphyrinogen-III synthase
MGLEAAIAPIFRIEPLPWTAPDVGDVDAVLLTSANAARLGGDGSSAFQHLPCFAVGEATADAAQRAGFIDVHIGSSDGSAVLEAAAEAGAKRLLHLAGRDHIDLKHDRVRIVRRVVYCSESVEPLPDEARAALARGAAVLLHSPRAAGHFSALVDQGGLPRAEIQLAAISEAAARAVGAGWRRIAVAPRPRDEALLEVAAKLCKTGASKAGNDG